MEKILKIEQSTKSGQWNYEGEADVLYLSPGGPKPAEGVDIVEGMVVLYDEQREEVIGLTVIGLRERLLRELREE
ncbi:hypothetical protein BH24ACT20_BH24ACT20_00290 [soil metagenome]|jgi:uncharacterized protein YuzE